MAVSVPDAGQPTLLDWLVSARPAVDGALSLRLFANDITPTFGTVTGDFIECDFAGYARVTIDRADWGAPVVSGHEASVEPVASPFTFNCTSGSQDVYGVFLVGVTTGITYYCRRLSPTRTVDPATPLVVRPVITLSSPRVP